MKAKEMLEMAYICGLESLEEAHLNITRHSMSLFPYTEMRSEEIELLNDMLILGMAYEKEGTPFIKDALVNDYLSLEERNTIDRDMEAYFQQND